MTKHLYRLVTLLTVFILTAGCGESLEDTYNDWVGDGKIRYLGKCSEVEVIPAWKRLIIKWTNSVDPLIENVKVTWITGGVSNEVVLDKGTTTYSIEGLVDLTYGVRVASVDADGNASLSEIYYGRPYTETHENILLFTRGIVKNYIVGNNLVLFFDTWSDNIIDFKLKYYTKSTGSIQTLQLTRTVFEEKWRLIEDVDTTDPVNKPITIERIGRIQEAPDLINFLPYHVTQDRVFTTEFLEMFERDYGITGEITDELVNSITTLQFDFDLASFDDIMYFPNLEKIEFGKNRYLREDCKDDLENAAEVTNVERSKFVLKVVQDILGVEIDQYNHHYFPDGIEDVVLTAKGNPIPPTLTFLDGTQWSISNSVTNGNSSSRPLSNLLDNDPTTFWESSSNYNAARTYTLDIDMGSPQTINGFRIVQKSYDKYSDTSSPYLMVQKIRLLVSNDWIVWEPAGYVETIILGDTNGEKNIVKLPESINARYFRVILSDKSVLMSYYYLFYVTLADISIF